MIVRGSYKLTVMCDRCSTMCELGADTKRNAIIVFRKNGWRMHSKGHVCPDCLNKERTP